MGKGERTAIVATVTCHSFHLTRVDTTDSVKLTKIFLEIETCDSCGNLTLISEKCSDGHQVIVKYCRNLKELTCNIMKGIHLTKLTSYHLIKLTFRPQQDFGIYDFKKSVIVTPG